MFNGIIYNQASVISKKDIKKDCIIVLKTKLNFKKSEIGSSVSCNGVCLTLTNIIKDSIYFDLSKETLNRTNLKYIKKSKKINIEKSIVYGQKISGHYVQGHVDTTGLVSNIVRNGSSWTVRIKINNKYNKYLVEKASISINGVSLTISSIYRNYFEITIIPHTLKLTNLIELKKKDLVNIEFDIFAKYFIKVNS